MTPRRALDVAVDVTPLAPLAASAAAKRALESNLVIDTPRRALSGRAPHPDATPRRAAHQPARAQLDDFIFAVDAGLPRRAASENALARRAESPVAELSGAAASRALVLPARAMAEPESFAPPCAARRGIDDTAIMPKYADKAFVKRPSRLKQIAVGLASLALLGGVGSTLGTLGAAAQSNINTVNAAAGDIAAHVGSQERRDGEAQPLVEPTDDFGMDKQLAAEAEVDREVKEQQAAEAAEAARLRAQAAAVTGNIAPGQKVPLSVEQAMANAQRLSGSGNYNNMCLALVSNFYGYGSSGAIGAQQAANQIIAAGQMHYDMDDIPVGALIWYDGSKIGNPYGHVAMYAGDGMVYSNGHQNGVGLMSINKASNEWGQPIIGWSNVWLPAAT